MVLCARSLAVQISFCVHFNLIDSQTSDRPIQQTSVSRIHDRRKTHSRSAGVVDRDADGRARGDGGSVHNAGGPGRFPRSRTTIETTDTKACRIDRTACSCTALLCVQKGRLINERPRQTEKLSGETDYLLSRVVGNDPGQTANSNYWCLNKKNLPFRLFHYIHNRRMLTAKRQALRFNRCFLFGTKNYSIIRIGLQLFESIRTIRSIQFLRTRFQYRWLHVDYSCRVTIETVQYTERPDDQQVHSKPAKTTDCVACNYGKNTTCFAIRVENNRISLWILLLWHLVYEFLSPSVYFFSVELVPYTLVLHLAASVQDTRAQSSTRISFYSSNLRQKKNFVCFFVKNFLLVYTIESVN